MTETQLRQAYSQHRDSLYRFAWRMTGSPEAAEDLVQECFLALLRKPESYDAGQAPLRPFLLAVVRNLSRKRWRSEQRWSVLEEDAFPIEPVDPAAGSKAELVGQAVSALPPLQREALVLFEYEELPLDEIARIVDAETGTVKARLHRARENLRRALAPLRERKEKPAWNR